MLQPDLEKSLTASPQYPLRIRQVTRTLFRGSIQSARRRSSAKGYSVRYTRTIVSCRLNTHAIPTETVNSTHRAACDYTTALCIKHHSIPRRCIPLTRPSQHLLATPTYIYLSLPLPKRNCRTHTAKHRLFGSARHNSHHIISGRHIVKLSR